MLIIEWTTVTFCSASLLTNKYREGVSSVKMRSTSPQWCVCTHTNSVLGFDLIQIEKESSVEKAEEQKKNLYAQRTT